MRARVLMACWVIAASMVRILHRERTISSIIIVIIIVVVNLQIKFAKKCKLELHCHLRPFIPSTILGFNHHAGSGTLTALAYKV